VAKKGDNDIYFTHNFMADGFVNSQYIKIIAPIINKIDAKAIKRIKANLYPGSKELVVHDRHFDYEWPHKGLVFYVNTNDGFTIFDNGTKIESIANRILFFDPSIPHSSTNCTDKSARININFNYF
jgi:hypothetical protein